MAVHVIYRIIVRAIKAGKLMEPFSLNDLIKACSYLNRYTCMIFLKIKVVVFVVSGRIFFLIIVKIFFDDFRQTNQIRNKTI